jgi:hypothetical protein
MVSGAARPTLAGAEAVGGAPKHDAEDTLLLGRFRPVLIGAVAVLGVLYLVSRLSLLAAWPIFFDEAHYTLSALLIGRDPLHTSPFIEVAYWGVPPLFTWIAAPLTRLVSDPLLACRLTSAGIGACGLLGIWKCARAVGGPAVALVAAAGYVLCPFVLIYNRMALVDGLLATISTFALLAAMRLAREPGVRTAVPLGACCMAAIFTKIFGPLDLALACAAVIAAPAAARRLAARAAGLAILMGLVACLVLLLAPGGQSLVLVAAQQQGGSLGLLARLTGQVTVIAQSYWLYVTPPVLVLAAIGAFSALRTPESKVLLLWALVSWLPFVVIHLSPRYLLSGAIPLIVLTAQGTVALGRVTAPEQGRVSGPVRRIGAGVLVVLAILACVREDVPLIAAPAHAAMVEGDREQYIAGWPAGYALERALADLRRVTHGQTVTLISPLQNPPADALAVLVGRDPHIHLLYRDLASLQHATALSRYPQRTFVVVCRPTGQQIDVRRAGLRLVIAEPNANGIGGVYMYTADRRLPYPLHDE